MFAKTWSKYQDTPAPHNVNGDVPVSHRMNLFPLGVPQLRRRLRFSFVLAQ
jgi:hypothetical protein